MESEFLAPARERGFFMERRYAETHAAYKQPIPYVAVTCEQPHGLQVFTMTRLAGGEKRLHGKRSIGVGGHVNPCDASADLFRNACLREIGEELEFNDPDFQPNLEPLGLLNDDSTEVGAVHVGLVFQLRLTAAAAVGLRIRESDGMSGAFEDYDALLALAEGDQPPFETWSTLLLRSGILGSRNGMLVS